jgi:PilZ domain
MLTVPKTQIHGKRRAPRYYLGGVVELTDLDSGRMKVALVRGMSLFGCFVKTEMPVKETARVAMKIAHSGTQISALGRIVNCVGDQSSRGLGIEFTEIDANDKKRLEACLSELAAAQKLPPVPSP